MYRLPLTSARDAVVAGDLRGALIALLEVWRETPAADLAELVELVGALAARDVPAPNGATFEERDAAWRAAAATGDPVLRHRLIETLADTSNAETKVARGSALDGSRDPRVAMKLVEIATARGMPHTSRYSTVWNPLFQSLARAGDPRVVRAIRDAPWTDLLRHRTRIQTVAFTTRLEKYLATLAAVVPEVPRLERDDADLVHAIRGLAIAARRDPARDAAIEAALLAAVYAAPDEMGPRAIYADWLQERGDLRGEFIALQLAHPDLKGVPPAVGTRLREILDPRRAAWLGPLETSARFHRFARGFLDAADVRGTTAQPDPRWSTVTEISGGLPASDALPMPVLRIAKNLDLAALGKLASFAQPPPLEVLSIETGSGWSGTSYTPEARRVVDAFADLVHRLPTLRRLEIANPWTYVQCRASPAQLGWVWRGTSIRALRLRSHLTHLVTWLGLAREAGLEELELDSNAWHISWREHALVMRQNSSFNFEEDLPLLCDGIESALDVAKVDLQPSSKAQWKLPQRRRMQECTIRRPDCAMSIYGYRPPE